MIFLTLSVHELHCCLMSRYCNAPLTPLQRSLWRSLIPVDIKTWRLDECTVYHCIESYWCTPVCRAGANSVRTAGTWQVRYTKVTVLDRTRTKKALQKYTTLVLPVTYLIIGHWFYLLETAEISSHKHCHLRKSLHLQHLIGDKTHFVILHNLICRFVIIGMLCLYPARIIQQWMLRVCRVTVCCVCVWYQAVSFALLFTQSL